MRTAEQRGRDVLEAARTLLRNAWAGKDLWQLTDPT